MIDYFYDNLSKITDFKPWKNTNCLFWELCKYCINNDIEIEVNQKVLSINKFCSIWEYELEKFYSQKIIESNNPNVELEKFMYFENYTRLTKLEYLNSSWYTDQIKNVLFIWGWPLPLTAIILAKKYSVKSKIIDYSEEAVELSRKLIKSLWLQDKIEVILWEASKYFDSEQYDICYVASLVFWWENNNEILSNISNLNFDLLLTRTSNWTRKLLYKQTDQNVLKKYFDIQSIIHPKNDIINSFILAYKKN